MSTERFPAGVGSLYSRDFGIPTVVGLDWTSGTVAASIVVTRPDGSTVTWSTGAATLSIVGLTASGGTLRHQCAADYSDYPFIEINGNTAECKYTSVISVTFNGQLAAEYSRCEIRFNPKYCSC